jgi:hypothetical protein
MGKGNQNTDGNFDISMADFSGRLYPSFEAVVNGVSDPFYMKTALNSTNVGITAYGSFTKDKDQNDELTFFFTGKNAVTDSYPNPFYPTTFFFGAPSYIVSWTTGMSAGDMTISFETNDNSGIGMIVSEGSSTSFRVFPSGGAELNDFPTVTPLDDGWLRVHGTFTLTGGNPFRWGTNVSSSNRQATDSVSIRKIQVEQKSYPTNFVGTHRNAESGCLFNLMDTGQYQAILVNTPAISGLNKKAGSTANTPLINGYLECNGVDSYIKIEDASIPQLANDSVMTAEFVAEIISLPASYGTLLGWNQTYPSIGIVSDGRLWFNYKDEDGNDSVVQYSSLSAGTKYHIAITARYFDDSFQGKIYVNGVLVAEKEDGYTLNSASTAMILGARTVTPGNLLNHKMHLFRYYQKELTAKQVLSNFNATRARFGI